MVSDMGPGELTVADGSDAGALSSNFDHFFGTARANLDRAVAAVPSARGQIWCTCQRRSRTNPAKVEEILKGRYPWEKLSVLSGFQSSVFETNPFNPSDRLASQFVPGRTMQTKELQTDSKSRSQGRKNHVWSCGNGAATAGTAG